MTILREEEHRALRALTLSGNILDLGGEKRSEYQSLFKGNFTLTTVNILPEAKPDIVADLEKPLPIPDASYDGVLLINVLEHVYQYQQLLSEAARVLKPGGTLIVVVPYLFPYHPSPDDFHRFSATTLRRALSSFAPIEIKPLGSGVCAARHVLIERLMPGVVQRAFGWLIHPLVRGTDALVTGAARLLHKKYQPSDYALGFCVTAKRV